MLRVKPSASRAESKEIYLLCKNYGNSIDPVAKKISDLKRKIDSLEAENDPQAKLYYEEATEMHKDFLKELID